MAQYMAPSEHYEALVATLDANERKVYDSLQNARPEACFRNRPFVIYQFVDRQVKVIDNVRVLDFICNDSAGASCEVRSEKHKRNIIVGYTPIQLFDYPVFLHIPLHLRVRWSTTPDAPQGGSLAFDVIVRTQSRLSLRERGVTYCETGVSYATEFEGLQR